MVTNIGYHNHIEFSALCQDQLNNVVAIAVWMNTTNPAKKKVQWNGFDFSGYDEKRSKKRGHFLRKSLPSFITVF
jgi:hypothetical protein